MRVPPLHHVRYSIKEQSLFDNKIVIPRGMRASGRMNLLGQDLVVAAEIDPYKFFVDANMPDPVVLGPLAFYRSNTETTVGPRVYIDVRVGLKSRAVVYMAAGFSLDALDTSGSCELTLGKVADGSIFSLTADTVLFQSFQTKWWLKAFAPVSGTGAATAVGPIGKLSMGLEVKVDGDLGVSNKIATKILSLITNELSSFDSIATGYIEDIAVRSGAIGLLKDAAHAICDAFGNSKSDRHLKAICRATISSSDIGRKLLDSVAKSTGISTAQEALLAGVVDTVLRMKLGSGATSTSLPMEKIFSVTRFYVAAGINVQTNAFGFDKLTIEARVFDEAKTFTIEHGLRRLTEETRSTWEASTDLDPFNLESIAQYCVKNALDWFKTGMPAAVEAEAAKIFAVATAALDESLGFAQDVLKVVEGCDVSAVAPSGCRSGKSVQTGVAGVKLCYTNCASGYSRALAGGILPDVCVKSNACPSKFEETHSNCWKPTGHVEPASKCPNGYTKYWDLSFKYKCKQDSTLARREWLAPVIFFPNAKLDRSI